MHKIIVCTTYGSKTVAESVMKQHSISHVNYFICSILFPGMTSGFWPVKANCGVTSGLLDELIWFCSSLLYTQNSTDLLGAQMLHQLTGLDLIDKHLIGSSSAICVLEERDTPVWFVFQKNLMILLVWLRQNDVPADTGAGSMNSWLVCTAGQDS